MSYADTVLRVRQMNFYGYGRRRAIMLMNFLHIYGMNGLMKQALSEKHMVIRWVLSISTRKE